MRTLRWAGTVGLLVALGVAFAVPIVSFPLPSSKLLQNQDINFAPGTSTASPSEINAACTGSTSNPTAPPGMVCIYLGQTGLNTTSVVALGSGHDFHRGFTVRAMGSPGYRGMAGSWAYTEP